MFSSKEITTDLLMKAARMSVHKKEVKYLAVVLKEAIINHLVCGELYNPAIFGDNTDHQYLMKKTLKKNERIFRKYNRKRIRRNLQLICNKNFLNLQYYSIVYNNCLSFFYK